MGVSLSTGAPLNNLSLTNSPVELDFSRFGTLDYTWFSICGKLELLSLSPGKIKPHLSNGIVPPTCAPPPLSLVLSASVSLILVIPDPVRPRNGVACALQLAFSSTFILSPPRLLVYWMVPTTCQSSWEMPSQTTHSMLC